MRLFISMFLAVLCTGVYAQQTVILATSDTTYSAIRELQEVVVTAEKRKLNPVNIPTALTVVTARHIPGENNPDLRNISGIVPNFYMQEGGLKLSTPLYIRGIGTVSGTPPVGLYVDGVPVFDKNAFVFDLYDICQIEVLRGPQTTLYGRNSINGLINITTNAPQPAFALQVKAGYASFATQTYQAILNLPVKNFYNKLSGSYHQSEGYFKNKYDRNKKSNPSDSYAFRYQGALEGSRHWSLTLGATFNHSFDGGYAYHAVDSLKEERYVVNYNTPSSYKRDILSSYLTLQKQEEKWAFQSVSSYSWTKDKQILDADFTYFDVFDNTKRSRQNLFTQELNLRSAEGRLIDWTVGAFGFYKDLTNRYLANFGKDKAYLLPLAITKASYSNNTITWGLAGYGQLVFKELWPGMCLTAGIRYDYEKPKMEYQDSLLFDRSSRFEEYHSSREKKNFSAWLPKFSLLQKWNDNLSLYLSIAKGYKAGGYNIIANEMNVQMVNLNYDEERLWNYEAGVKYFSPDKKFNLNATVFFIDWEDQQIFVMGMMGPCIKNAGDAHSIGGEIDIHWEFLPHLTYLFSVGYSHAEYYHNLDKNHEGNRIVMAPEFTGHTGLMYRQFLSSRWLRSIAASTTVTGFGTQYFDEANLLKQDPYFLWNVDFSFGGKWWEFHVWGKNILDKAYFSYMLNNPVGSKLPQYQDMCQSGAPARFGASLTFKI